MIALSIFFATNVVATASCSCPSGFTPKSFQYTLATTSCEITINYCTNCSPTGHTSVYLCDIVVPYGNCTGITVDAAFWQEIKEATLIENMEDCNLGMPPCPGRIQMDFYKGDCKRLVYDDYYETITIEDCDEEGGTCVNYYSICWDPITQDWDFDFYDYDVTDPGECGPALPKLDEEDRFLLCFTTCN